MAELERAAISEQAIKNRDMTNPLDPGRMEGGELISPPGASAAFKAARSVSAGINAGRFRAVYEVCNQACANTIRNIRDR